MSTGRESTFLITWPHHLGEKLLRSRTLWFTCQLLTTELSVPCQRTAVCWRLEGFSRQETRSAVPHDRPEAKASRPLRFRGQQFFGCHGPLGLPQVAVDGDRVYTGRQCFRGDVAELLPVRIVLVKAFDHFFRDRFRAYPSQFADFLRFRTVSVQRPELTA